jgi:hypothetical protein
VYLTLPLFVLIDDPNTAMENWGLVTYRETALLIDEQRSSSQMKQRVCAVVAHELAHQVCCLVEEQRAPASDRFEACLLST